MKKAILLLSTLCFFGIIQGSEKKESNIIPGINVEVEMTKQQISELTPEEKTKIMFLAKVGTTINDINNYFSTLLPEKDENLTEQEWNELIQNTTPILQKNGGLEEEINPLIFSMEKRVVYAPDSESENQWSEQLNSLKNQINYSAKTAMYKLHRLYNSGKIEKAEFKTLYGMIIDFINRIPNFGAIQATFNIIPSTNVEVEMTKQQISKLTPEEKTKLMFLAEVSTTTNRINQYFLTLLPVEAENLTEQQWSELIQKVQLALTNIETDITPLISAMQKRIFYAPDPESKKQWFEHLASFRKETSTPMETMLNKLDQLRKLNKIDKANFDILFNMVVDFLNRFDAAVNI